MEVIEPKSGAAFEVQEGQTIRIVDREGEQVSDFVCFSAENHAERFSQAASRVNNDTIRPTTGDRLFSNRNRVLFTIKEDPVGRHDMMFPPCSQYVYERLFQVGKRSGCHEHLSRSLAPYDIRPTDVPDPLNVFMNTRIRQDGSFEIMSPRSAAGDYLEMKAEMDCLVALTACSDDISECNGKRCTSIGLEFVS